jgi:hypothetical protein
LLVVGRSGLRASLRAAPSRAAGEAVSDGRATIAERNGDENRRSRSAFACVLPGAWADGKSLRPAQALACRAGPVRVAVATGEPPFCHRSRHTRDGFLEQ